MGVPLAALAVLAKRLAGGETVQGLAELLRLLSDVSGNRNHVVRYMHPMTMRGLIYIYNDQSEPKIFT